MNKAIGSKDGVLKLYRDPTFEANREIRSQGTSAYYSESWGLGEPEAFQVEMIDICRFLREVSGPVEILKMDIEGAELDVLERLLDEPEKDMVKTIFVETHEAQMPQPRIRTKALRNRIRNLKQPRIFMNWQ